MFYGEGFYGEGWYSASPYRVGTELSFSIKARIVKPYVAPPPVMDTIAVGLAQRFNFLQQGIQAFGLFNKIEYNKGQDLDDNWGAIYDLPRMTGETDADYRARLKTYARVLIGSGTTPNTEQVLDTLIGIPNGSEVESRWPGKAIITFSTVEAMRAAKSKTTLLNSVLPGMFAAGVEYEYLTPIQDFSIEAAIRGDATQNTFIRAAIQTDQELSLGIDALIAYGRLLDMTIQAAIAGDQTLYSKIKATLRGERTVSMLQRAAIRGDSDLDLAIRSAVRAERDWPTYIRAAIQTNPELVLTQKAAISRTFEIACRLSAYIMLLKTLETKIITAIQSNQETTVGIRVRIAKPS